MKSRSQKTRALILAIAAKVCKGSLYEFVKRAWKVVVQNHEFIDSKHVRAICEHLQAVTEGKITNLLINVPPRHTKSLIVSVFWPAWVWAKNAAVQWLFASKTQTVSLRDNRKCRLLLESPWYRSMFSVKLATDQNVKSYYATSKGGHRLSTSAGSQNTGLDADVLVIDDLHGINDTEEQVAKDVEWAEDTFWSRGNFEGAPKVVIGQRVRANDVSGHIISGYAGADWTHLMLPMEYEEARHCSTGLVCEAYPDGFEDWRKEPGEILAPERFSPKYVAEQKLKPGRHARLNQQNPTPTEGGILKKAWLQERFHSIDVAEAAWGTSCDSPFKKGKNTDFFVLQLIAKIETKFKVVAQVRKRASFTEMEQSYEGFVRHWEGILGVRLLNNLLEVKASGDAIKSKLEKKINIVPFNPGRDSKEQRFETVSPVFQARNVELPAPNAVLIRDGKVVAHLSDEFVPGYVEEVGTVPFAEHDDQADTTTQYILHDMLQAQKPGYSAPIPETFSDPYTVERRRTWR